MPKTNNASLLCIPDTNSLIHMRDIEVVNKKLWLWLWQEFDVRLSETICNELHDHKNLTDQGMENKCKKSIWSFGRNNSKLKKLEQVLVQQFDIKVDGRKNQGECHNCCVAIDAILSGQYRQVLFLTNELKTTDPNRDGSLAKVFKDIPIGKIWTSLDFVLYLFTRHRKRLVIGKAREILRNINGRIGGKTHDKNNVVAKRFSDYNNKLERISKSLSQIPY